MSMYTAGSTSCPCLLPEAMRGNARHHLRQQRKRQHAVTACKRKGGTKHYGCIRVPQQRALEQSGDVAPHRTSASLTCPVAHVPVHRVHGVGRGAATARRQLGECDGQYKTNGVQPCVVQQHGEKELYTGCLALSCQMSVFVFAYQRESQICSLVPSIGRHNMAQTLCTMYTDWAHPCMQIHTTARGCIAERLPQPAALLCRVTTAAVRALPAPRCASRHCHARDRSAIPFHFNRLGQRNKSRQLRLAANPF
jgi:hypothetical protein